MITTAYIVIFKLYNNNHNFKLYNNYFRRGYL